MNRLALLLPALLLPCLCLLPSGETRAGPGGGSLAVVDQASLNTWWHSTNALWMTDTAYRVDGTHLEDGVCSVDLHEGILMPVYSGKAPVSEQQVGVVFVGKGTLKVDFPDAGDAQAFGNQMVRRVGSDPDEVRGVAAEGEPFETQITRGMILSVDPQVRELLYELEPVGAGFVYRESADEEVDAEYVVTEKRGKLRARVIATNLLPDRRNALVELGLDPVAMLRQDRMLHDELGFPGEHVRLVADFNTDTSFRVAAEQGATLGARGYDQWVTCFRDGLGQSGLGYRSLAFTYGEDNQGDHHFQRLSGEAWRPAEGESSVKPAVRLDPVSADVLVEARPANFFSNAQRAKVDSTITLQAHGAPLRHVIMGLPADYAVKGTWKMRSLTLEDGTPVPWVALSADLPHRDTAALDLTQDSTAGGEVSEDVGSVSQQDGTSSGPGGGTGAEASAGEVEADLGETVDIGEAGESRNLIENTGYRYEIIALLPELVPVGEQVKLVVDWEADWQYANWSYQGRPLGTTTGFQPVLPEILPELYENAWDFHLKMAVPGVSLRTFSVAAAGDTIDKWDDVDSTGRRWVETQGEDARDVGVAIGQWKERDEPAGAGMPAVSVHLFFDTAGALTSFPPEVRRVVSFLERFLPDYPQEEVEVYQGAGSFAGTAMRSGFYDATHGLVGVTTVKQYTMAGDDLDVGEASTVAKENPHLAQIMIARQVAHQYWGQLLAPATSRDRWLETALSDAYAAYYVRAALGKDPFDERLEVVRNNLENPTERAETYRQVNRYRRPYSLTGSTALSDVPHKMRAEYGFYFMTHMLRRKVGDQLYFLALDNLAANYRGETLSTEQFQRAMEAASGQDLGPYFDYWVHGGSIPDLTLQLRFDQGEQGMSVHGCLGTDVPFGLVEVPVQLFDPKTGRIAAGPVKVVQGLGSFTIAGWQNQPEVELDPEKLILAYGRKVDTIKGSSRCEEAAAAAEPEPEPEPEPAAE